MKKIIKIKVNLSENEQEDRCYRVSSDDCIDESYVNNRELIEYFGVTIGAKIISFYKDSSNMGETGNLVLLTDKELKGLEAKSKQ
jgi:hypothetical protein